MANKVVWFDIPVTDLDRAIEFYSQVLRLKIEKAEIEPNYSIGVFPHENNEVARCLYVSDEVSPAKNGPLLYLNANGRLDEAEKLAGQFGGKILQSKHSIGPHGFRSIVLDSEGNRIALHSE